ncbi:MOSC domain-containing protein [Pseudoalteromonas sp. NZS71]|uniref:MOSC domain-containing protein n=1 Tax=unclassified Pseudoalteromonas TaxID=194690 RepID=UPI00041466C1|nr:MULTISPECIES: MOSC domain-containing protein [unclassified Pseudoalteromonas]MBH0062422.1 MOSC domain-containing protein [Pseudoalteromonas sp. NZS71]
MKIISTNISKIKTLIHNGKEVKTGIFKTPTNEPVVIEKLNIIGDEQADLVNHGGVDKAVYAFSHNHYEYWQKTLENENLSSGVFGENFTISDLDEANIHIGDHIRIGTALLEVSQPRVPCFKLAIALNNKNSLKLFTQHYCTGVYFRVLEQGVAKTGDSVVIEKKASHDISVKKLFQAFFDKKYVGYEDILLEALTLPELAVEWQEKLKKKLAIKSE